jgi:hypothetical protein
MLELLGIANSVYPLGLPTNICLFTMNSANGFLIRTGSQITPNLGEIVDVWRKIN